MPNFTETHLPRTILVRGGLPQYASHHKIDYDRNKLNVH